MKPRVTVVTFGSDVLVERKGVVGALHTLLGTLYTQTGLPRQAAAAFDEAQSLMTRDTK